MTTTKETVDKIVIGIKLKAEKNLIKREESFSDFLNKVTCNLNVVLSDQENLMTCKWYDEDSGELYFHFDYPLNYEILSKWFPDNELIFKLEE